MIVVSLTGRLTREPELRNVETEESESRDLCQVRIAARDSRNQTVFLDCVQWGPAGRAAATCLEKGSLVAFTGELRLREHEIGGTRRQFFSAVGRIEFLEGRRRPGSEAGDTAPTPTPFD